MWEDNRRAAAGRDPRKRTERSAKVKKNLVLWAQILLCLAAVGLHCAHDPWNGPFCPAADRIRDGNAA